MSLVKRFRVHAVGGETLDMRGVSTRIYDNTTIGWLLPKVAEQVEWPASHIRLAVGDQVFEHAPLIENRC